MAAMDRRCVTSRAVAAIGYDPLTGDLEIEFRTGRVYGYSHVPPAVHAWLLRVRNKGSFVARHLSGRYGERSLPDPRSPDALPLEQALRESLKRL